MPILIIIEEWRRTPFKAIPKAAAVIAAPMSIPIVGTALRPGIALAIV